MGTVYRAVDETLHREVAIKVLNAELNDPEVARRFRAEAITVARLNHPGIATIYELFEHDGQWLMVMEFVRGETLEHLVERLGPLPVEQAADLCMQALTALAHAHSMGVVHRDLKPANLMVTEAGIVKIMDFGIARVAGSEHLTSAGFMMGTPAYMAPEQVLGHEIDARADLYAMGVVFYRLATAKLPFKGETPFAMAQSQVNDPPTPVGLMRAGLPPWVEQVIGRALAKAPEDRFQTADEFRETIKRGLAGLPIEAAPNAFVPAELMVTSLPGTMPVLPSLRQPTGSVPASTSGAIPTGAPPAVSTGAVPTVSTGAVPGASTAPIPMTTSGAIPASPTSQVPAPSTGSIPTVSTGSVPVMPSGPVPLQPTTGRMVDLDMTVMAPHGQPPGMGTGANDLTMLSGTGGLPAMGTAPVPMSAGQTGATAMGTGPNAIVQTGATAATQTAATAIGQTGTTAAMQTGVTAASPALSTAPATAKKTSSLPLVAVAAGVVVIGAVAWFLWARSHASSVTVSAPASSQADAAPTTPAAGAADASATPTPPVVPATDPVATNPVSSAAGAAAGAAGAPTTGGDGRSGTLSGRPDSSGALPTSTAPREKTPEVAEPLLVYSDAKLLVINGNKAQEQDVIINFVAGQISMAPKKGGKALWSLAYKKVAHATYVRAKDPKWDVSLPAPPDNLDIPGFMRGSRHWLVIQAKTADPGYVILRLDDSNWSDVLDTLEARSGVKVDRLGSGGK